MSTTSVPKVSVIIATYNYARYIADALRSVEEQTLQDWECLVIDDASADDTEKVVAIFVERDPRFKYIRLDKNRGVSAARNRGLKEAKAGLIQLLDADDIIAPGKLEAHSGYLDGTPDVSVVYSDFIRFQGHADLDGPGELTRKEKFEKQGRSVISRLLRGNAFRLNAMVFRRSLVEELGGFRDELRYVEDWDFWMRIASAGHLFHYLDEPKAMAAVRVDHRSLSSDLPAMYGSQLPVRQRMWIQGGLDLRQRISLLLRYCDFLLELAVVKGGPIVFLAERRSRFIPLVLATSVLIFPIWVVIRPFVRPWH